MDGNDSDSSWKHVVDHYSTGSLSQAWFSDSSDGEESVQGGTEIALLSQLDTTVDSGIASQSVQQSETASSTDSDYGIRESNEFAILEFGGSTQQEPVAGKAKPEARTERVEHWNAYQDNCWDAGLEARTERVEHWKADYFNRWEVAKVGVTICAHIYHST